MRYRRVIAAGVSLISGAVSLILAAAHTKRDMIDLRRERSSEVTGWKQKNMDKINQGINACRSTPGAILLDVREKADYDEGHIPGAVHADLQTIQYLHYGLDTPLFLYCYRGTRSRMAAGILRDAGFQQVTDIGGIDWYTGDLEV